MPTFRTLQTAGRPLRPSLLLACILLTCASAASAADSGTQVEKCGHKFGTITLSEPQTGWGYLQQYGLGSPAALIRIMIQQSGCFDVVERGVAMQNMQQERALMNNGELREDSNVGQGQMQVADFVMTPTVQVGAKTTGGISGGVLGLLGHVGSAIGALGGGLKFKEASTSITIADVRSSIQVAAAEGQATKTDFSLFGWGLGAGGIGGLGGFTDSPEGKVVAASFVDNYNKIVTSIRDQTALIKATTPESQANAAGSTRAQAPQKAGQVLTAKLASVKIYEAPSRDAKVLATLPKGEEMVASGEVKEGFIQVDSANASGWVQRTLVGPTGGGGQSLTPPPGSAPVAPIAQPGGLYGTYGGVVDGDEQGTFTVTVASNNIVYGSALLSRRGRLTIQGSVDAQGNIIGTGNAGNPATATTFLGRVDPASGAFSGNWNGMLGNGGGSFRGSRTQ